MSGTCEVAFDMIQSVFLKPDQIIVGLYEAALPHNLAGGKEQTGLAQYLSEQLVSNFKDSVFIQLKADLPPLSDDTPLKDQLTQTSGLLFKQFWVNANGSISHVDKQQNESKCSKTEYVIKNYVKNGEYLKLYDFDDHFADVSKDFRN
jgi:hypothetical protein